MSVNASKHELTQLIYRHLKEHGLHSAADELQRLSPQEESKTSASLLDIYNSWLTGSKKKKKMPNSYKHSGFEAQERTLTKAKTKKKDKSAEKPKKSVPAKMKKSDGMSAENVPKAKKPKTQSKNKVVAAGGDNSDSDSSLDLDKWKKLISQMTESDLAKMETINALESSAPPPRKKRVRTPRAKPPAKRDAPVQQNNGGSGKDGQVEEKAMAESSTKNITAKRSRPEKTALGTSCAPPIAVGDRLATPVPSPSKRTPEKVERKDVTPSKDKTDETMPESQKKKKKKRRRVEMTEGNVEETTHETGGDGKDIDSKEETQETDEMTSEPQKKKKKKKMTGGNVEETTHETAGDGKDKDSIEETQETDETTSEPQKKKKKKKKKKMTGGNVEETTYETGGDGKDKDSKEETQETDEMTSEPQKKKKKKKMTGGNVEKTTHETGGDGKDKESIEEKQAEDPEQEIRDQLVEEKKMKKKDIAVHLEEVLEGRAEGDAKTTVIYSEENPPQNTEMKRKKKKNALLKNNYTELLAPPNTETSSPSAEKKKKKIQAQSVEVKVSIEDVAGTPPLPGDPPHKKKKNPPQTQSLEDV
ncbi:uncharacterized protein tcof1 [Gasterosteus aculeatus]